MTTEPIESGERDKKQLIGALEAVLFVSGEPVSFTRIEKTLNVTATELAELLAALQEKLAHDDSAGLQVITHHQNVSLATKSLHAGLIEQLTKAALQENLSRAALEVLAIIAYRAPIARVEIEAIRGVNCSFTLRNLLLRDLIERIGNPTDSRGYLYQPTFKFLQSLGLSSIGELPDFETLRNDDRLKQMLADEAQDSGAVLADTSDAPASTPSA
ncbi:MAG: SMC-Scp complex subunit ScpB [Candidatus Moranbacteria bacterium]|nr:SMC-Scp complex subunit ScpB [Candidatus Moranbacteria bacterium]MBP6034157.1 SMC-Scp complex subunit ScpB [Candidatus Moranbacteria bacterium]MBP7695742.1 SMC-Scp complex subunit ScpB [Candidatus Moranbacteria bacterium]